MDDNTGPRGLWQSVLGLFTRKRPQSSATPAPPPRTAKRKTWLRGDAFLQGDGPGEVDPESVARTLGALEYIAEHGISFPQTGHEQYPNLRRMIENLNRASHADPGTGIRVGKRRRECDDAIEELSHWGQERKKRRLSPRGELTHESCVEENAVFTELMRRHLLSLDNALRRHWVCVCRKCSGLSVRLPLPQHLKDLKAEASFDVFFGVRSVPATALQEAKITVRHNDPRRRSFEHLTRSPPDFAHICQSIKESLGQRNCLHFALENGAFQRLRPQPKTFGSDQTSRTVSLSALFKRQQEILGGEPVLSLKGKRVLAVTLASALLPFLETPWLQFPFNHSKIRFFEPRHGEFPDITKPFLVLEHLPIVSAHSTDSGDSPGASKHIIDPNPSVQALGILLCELQYCTPVELMRKGPRVSRNVNDDYYTCYDKLQTLKNDVCLDYYLATRACLTGEFRISEPHADFEDINIRRLFYQNVVRRLEAVVFNIFGIRLENLSPFDPRQNEACWGPIGQEVVRFNTARASPHRPFSDTAPVNPAFRHPDLVLQMAAQTSSGLQARGHPAKPSGQSSYFFDASHQTGPEHEDPLSENWMDNLLSSIHRYVDPVHDLAEPVRIAILDSGLDPENPFLVEDQQLANPRIKEARSFIHGTEPHDVRDEIGHGTHALGLLLKVAPCAEIYVARIARRETLDPHTYGDITKARLSRYQSRLLELG
ncbi:intracellular serine protease [Xylariomycetidae sp. FL0641]|nr:intracellular serine protease [Xylariomycetidae sp. FL0641]